MPFLSAALDPIEVQYRFTHRPPKQTAALGRIALRSIRVVRHKPGRRCLIEYFVDVESKSKSRTSFTILGKTRAKRLKRFVHRLHRDLRLAGFDDDSQDGVSVPEPPGMPPDWNMWLQRKVPGEPATELMAQPDGVALARRIARAIHKLHVAGAPTRRRHTIDDELRILRRRLEDVAEQHP
ncbi:MAG: aminoglycoside phosphotransferase family protein, partial [Planctomycetes bacterium]|nr:aminoglycoside phosphotransferase family protein [Planctomycetota bacterium]